MKNAAFVLGDDETALRCSNDIWEGIKITEHLFPPMYMQSPVGAGHRIAFNLGASQVVQVKDGSGAKEKVYATGSFGMVPRGEYNTIGWNKDLRVLVADLDPLYAEKTFEIENISFKQRRGVVDGALYKFAGLFKNELPYLNIAGKIYGQSIAAAFVSHLVTNYADLNKKILAPKGKLSARQLKSVIEYCNDTLAGNPRLEQLSGSAYLSNFHFLRLFKQTLGVTPHKYILQVKIERAKQLLNKNKFSHGEIAAQLGFADQSHFCKVFKKATGVAPTKFVTG